MFLYVCTQVDTNKDEDKDDVVDIEGSVAIPATPLEGEAVAAPPFVPAVPPADAVAKESPSKRQKLDIDPIADIVPSEKASATTKTFRSMYYKSGVCLIPNAYSCK